MSHSPTPARRRVTDLAKIGVSLLLAGLAVEGAVRALERLGWFGAVTVPRYEEAYQGSAWRSELGDAGFLTPGFAQRVSNEYGQPVEWVHNSLGFRRREETARARPPGVLRIVMLGDSFVAGHRLGQEQTVGYRLEQWLRGRGYPGAEVLIAAIEEPTIGLEYLESFGVHFKPQVVLLGITLGNDLGQVVVSLAGEHPRYVMTGAAAGSGRPQLERNPEWDQSAQYAWAKSVPIPEPYLLGVGVPPAIAMPPSGGERSFFELHYVSRLRAAWAERRARSAGQPIVSFWGEYRSPRLIDGNGIGLHLAPAPPEVELMYSLLERVLAAYRRVCDEHGIRLIVMIQSDRYQVQPRDLDATMKTYALRPSSFDLMQPNRRIARMSLNLGIPCLDATGAMAAEHARSGLQMFMPHGDMHWNAAGARAFLDGIRDDLLRELPSPSSITAHAGSR